MYVVPSGFTAPTAGGQNDNQPVIGWQNLVTIGNVTAGTEDPEYPATNLANPITAAPWRGLDETAQDIIVTLAGETIDYVAIALHNFGSAAIPLTLSVNDGGGYDVIIPTFTPDADDRILLMRFTPQVATAVKIALGVAPGTGDEIPEAAVLYVGRLLILPRRIYVPHIPLNLGRVTDVANGRSESGNFLGRIVTGEGRQTSVQLQNLSASFVRSDLDPFLEAAQQQPFFFAWRPDTYPEEVGFAWLTNDPQPANQRSNGMMSAELALGGIV